MILSFEIIQAAGVYAQAHITATIVAERQRPHSRRELAACAKLHDIPETRHARAYGPLPDIRVCRKFAGTRVYCLCRTFVAEGMSFVYGKLAAREFLMINQHSQTMTAVHSQLYVNF